MGKIRFSPLFGGLLGCHVYTKDPRTMQILPKGAHRVCGTLLQLIDVARALVMAASEVKALPKVRKMAEMPFFPLFWGAFGLPCLQERSANHANVAKRCT